MLGLLILRFGWLLVVERIIERGGFERAVRSLRAERRYPTLAPSRRTIPYLDVVVIVALYQARWSVERITGLLGAGRPPSGPRWRV